MNEINCELLEGIVEEEGLQSVVLKLIQIIRTRVKNSRDSGKQFHLDSENYFALLSIQNKVK